MRVQAVYSTCTVARYPRSAHQIHIYFASQMRKNRHASCILKRTTYTYSEHIIRADTQNAYYTFEMPPQYIHSPSIFKMGNIITFVLDHKYAGMSKTAHIDSVLKSSVLYMRARSVNCSLHSEHTHYARYTYSAYYSYTYVTS